MSREKRVRIAVVGGGAAGFFGAIACAENHPEAVVTVFEGTRQPLYKVGISGGGRCNVTQHCFDPALLTKAYPRGGKELIGPYGRFQPRDTIEWFRQHGVKLKTEEDGRMFPVTDDSATIIDCLQQNATKAGVVLRTGARVVSIARIAESHSSATFALKLKSGEEFHFNQVLLATGSSPAGYEFAKEFGHTIVPCVPSLFTFNIKDQRLKGLEGVSIPNAHLKLKAGEGKPLEQTGPVLITHWGLSGPAVLKLSAWGARQLFLTRYQADLEVNWLADRTIESVTAEFHAYREAHPKRVVAINNFLPTPNRYWSRIVEHSGVPEETTWSHITKEGMNKLAEELIKARFRIVGKGEFKEEFVTCGGVKLSEVDFRTLESRICPGLYLAGELLDIDGITGGYNFQSAWTTGWIAGKSMAE